MGDIRPGDHIKMTDTSKNHSSEAVSHTLVSEQVSAGISRGVLYEKRPAHDRDGKPVSGLYNAWITLDNPSQLNSYTT